MRLPILCGILGAVFLFVAHDRWELKTAQEQERQAWALNLRLGTELDAHKRYEWEPPWGLARLAIDFWQTSNAVMMTARTTDGKASDIRVDNDSMVILSEESIEAITDAMIRKTSMVYDQGCYQRTQDRFMKAMNRHPVWDGVVDVIHTEPPYSDEYEAGFDAAFNIGLGAIQAYE